MSLPQSLQTSVTPPELGTIPCWSDSRRLHSLLKSTWSLHRGAFDHQFQGERGIGITVVGSGQDDGGGN